MERLLRDVRFGLKGLWKEKTFSVTVLVTLAVCIGANVAIFSVIHTVLLEPLPFEASDRLVSLYNSYPGMGAGRSSNSSIDFFQRRENIAAFEGVAAYRGSENTVGESGSIERVSSMRVSPSFFPLLGIEPALGRGFTEDEMEVGNDLKVVLTHAFWQDYFAGAPDVVGRELRVDGRPYAVVGVLAPDFIMPNRAGTRFFLPIAFSEEQRRIDDWHSNNFQMLARLAPGVSLEQAISQNLALNEALIDQWPVPGGRQILEDAGYTTIVVPAQADMVRDIEPVLYMLWVGVGFVLLIGCVNVGNLMLVRAQSRRSEVATKLALGAPRLRVARQVLTEAVVIGSVGGAMGVGVGALGLRLLMRLGIDDLPRGTEVGIDGNVILFTAAIAVGAGVLFGSIPVAQLMKGDLASVFRSGGRSGTANRRDVFVRSTLVTSQVAVAFVMLIGAGLMFMSFQAALAVDPGFETEDVLTAFVALPATRYEDGPARMQFTDDLLRVVNELPGVTAASMTSMLPFTGNNSNIVAMPEWYEPKPGESLLSPLQTWVGPEYFDVMGIDLVSGRVFDASDGPDAANVIVIDERLADRYWPEGDPIGDRMIWGSVPGATDFSEDDLFTVVGVVETIKQNDLTAPIDEHVGAYYFTYRQRPQSSLTLVVRSTMETAELTTMLREALGRSDSELPLYGIETMASRIDDSLRARKVPLVLLGVFAFVALFLAVLGIYGALAYSVTQRNKEIGIRMAIGSTPEDIFRRVVRHGMMVTGVGLGAGVVVAMALARLVQSMLFGIQATDVRLMVAVAVTMAVVGLLGSLIPARRATKVDPVRVLTGYGGGR